MTNETEQNFNFNDPLEVTEIFRVIIQQAPSRNEEEDEDEDPILIPKDGNKPNPKSEMKEYAFKHAICWEDIRGIKQYMYPDDWVQYKGEKFYLKLSTQSEDILIFGSYFTTLSYWKAFRNIYPLEHN